MLEDLGREYVYLLVLTAAKASQRMNKWRDSADAKKVAQNEGWQKNAAGNSEGRVPETCSLHRPQRPASDTFSINSVIPDT